MSADEPGLTAVDAPVERRDDPDVLAAPTAPTPVLAANGHEVAVAGPLVARRVRRILRRIDPWSVLKFSFVVYLCAYVMVNVAGVLLWQLAASADLIDNVESLIMDLGSYRSYELLPGQILAASLLGGAVLVVLATGLTVLATVFFNLIADLVGGIRVVVIEEDSARPRPVGTGSVSASGPDQPVR